MSHSEADPRPPGLGLRMLEQTEEDKEAGMYTVIMPDHAQVRMNARQVQILSMPLDQRRHVPQDELVELGKIVMEAQADRIDDMLEAMDLAEEEVPEYVDEPYEYEPLKYSKSLRLIRLLPETEEGLVQIALEEYNFEEHVPNYHCLSYCWGNPHAQMPMFDFFGEHADEHTGDSLFPIACNGKTLYVHSNLYDALKQLPDSPALQRKTAFPHGGKVDMFTDLHVSVVQGNMSLVKTNLFRGAEVDCKDDSGRTALTLAVIDGSAPIAQVLLEAGADPQEPDYTNQSPLDHALRLGHQGIVEMLLNQDIIKPRYRDRRNKHSGRGSKIWIDAICINQANIDELTAQVRIMDRIYAEATFTTVWLGKEDQFQGLARSTIEKLFPAAQTTALGESDIIPFRNEPREKYARAGVSYVSQREWAALAALYSRQNFRRLWCLQEMVLPDDIVMYLGPHEIPWEEFMMVTEQLYILQSKFPVPPSSMFRAVYTTAVEREAHLISELRMRKKLDNASEESRKQFWSHTNRFYRGKGRPSSIPLLEMLMMTITFQCSNPQDQIYGMLGMCGNHPESPKITIDYRRPFEELYAEVTKFWIKDGLDDHPLDFVAQIKDSANRDRNSLPTWTLDFGQPGITRIAQPSYCADGELEFDKSLLESAQWNELPVQGLRIDTIASMASHRKTKDTVSLMNFDPAWFSLLHEMDSTYITGQPRTEVLWRTLCLDQTSGYDFRTAQASENSLEAAVPAMDMYAEQFRQQLKAMLLAFGERTSAWRNKLRNTRGGVLLQALAGAQLRREQGSDEIFKVMAPTAEEQTSIKDLSLDGSNFADDAIQTALTLIDEIVKQDGTDCQIPTRADFEAFLASPTYRVWQDPGGEVPFDTQIADWLPPGEDGFRTQFVTYNGGRRLFLTNRGYLGLGPMTMAQNDEVWILKGCRCPMLLRRQPDDEKARYQYVGDVYVHGIMQGEGLSLAEDFEDITLI